MVGAYAGVEQAAANLAEMLADNGHACNDQSQQALFAQRAKTAERIAEWMVPFHETSLELNLETDAYEIRNGVSLPFEYAFK